MYFRKLKPFNDETKDIYCIIYLVLTELKIYTFVFLTFKLEQSTSQLRYSTPVF